MMKQVGPIILAVFLIMGMGCSPTKIIRKQPTKIKQVNTIAVLPFSSNKSAVGESIAVALATHLGKSGFSIVTQAEFEQKITVHGLTLKKVVENYKILIGKISGVDAIIIGDASVRDLGGYIEHIAECTARMIQTDSGETLLEVQYLSKDAGMWNKAVPAEDVGKAMARRF